MSFSLVGRKQQVEDEPLDEPWDFEKGPLDLRVFKMKVHLEGGMNRCKANLMTNDAKLKTKCNTLSITKECSRIPGEGLWTISSKFL